MSDHTIRTTTALAPPEADEAVRAALQEEGFGILTEIDVQATLKEKIDEDIEPYVILGACNPPLAFRALETDRDIGALLPCNVVVRGREGGGSEIIAADPEAMLALAGDAAKDVARDATVRIRHALAGLDES